jgi:hypothetical protein
MAIPTKPPFLTGHPAHPQPPRPVTHHTPPQPPRPGHPQPPVTPHPTPPVNVAGDPPWLLLMKACGYDENGNPAVPTYADASGVMPGAPPVVVSDAGNKPLLYETWWGFCPVVGSFNQMVWGRTKFDHVCGGVFFVLDCTMVAPVFKGVLYGLRAGATAGLKLAARGAGTVLQHEALLQFGRAGGQVLARDAAEAMIRRELANGHVLVIAAETSSNAVNHTVAYIFEKGTGQIYKLHGGITQLAKLERNPVLKATLESTVGRLNTMKVFPLAKDPLVVAKWWEKMAGSNAFSSFWRGGLPRGCAGTSVLILEKLSEHGAITGVPRLTGYSRWIPLYLDRALGSHVLNHINVVRGTIAQGTAALAFREAAAFGLPHAPGGFQKYQFDWSDWLPSGGAYGSGNMFAPVSGFYSENGELVDSILGMPASVGVMADFAGFQAAASDFPGGRTYTTVVPPPYVQDDAPAPAPTPTPPPAGNTLEGTWYQGNVTTSRRVFKRGASSGEWDYTDYVWYGNPPKWSEGGGNTLRELGNISTPTTRFFSYAYGSNPNMARWKLAGNTLQELNLDGKSPFGPPWHR